MLRRADLRRGVPEFDADVYDVHWDGADGQGGRARRCQSAALEKCPLFCDRRRCRCV